MSAAFLQPEAATGLPAGLRDRSPRGCGTAPRGGAETDRRAREQPPDRQENLLCRACRRVITSPSEMTAVQGSHAHTFANPGGILYQVGCFRSACGCGYFGAPSDEFTWFRGYKWRVACCSTCGAHLGWLFVSADLHSFHAFILNRLVGGQAREEGQ